MKHNESFRPSTIRAGRALKAMSRAEKTSIAGPTSIDFKEQLVPELNVWVSEAVANNRDWLEAEWNKISQDLDIKQPRAFSDVLPYFQKLLEKRAKLYLKTTNTPVAVFASDVNLVNTLCEQAAFDFIMSLRQSAQAGETINNALNIASLSHWLNPLDIKRLQTKYTEVDLSVIKRAALSYPKNPDAFIEQYQETVERLQGKYPALDQGVIKRAALSYPKNPEAFIDWFIEAEKHFLSEARPPKKSILHQILFANTFKSIAELERLM